MSAEAKPETLTDEMIREHRRKAPDSLDMLMVAIHSAEVDLKTCARRWFCDAINARARTP